jgi:hypothetical protein
VLDLSVGHHPDREALLPLQLEIDDVVPEGGEQEAEEEVEAAVAEPGDAANEGRMW